MVKDWLGRYRGGRRRSGVLPEEVADRRREEGDAQQWRAREWELERGRGDGREGKKEGGEERSHAVFRGWSMFAALYGEGSLVV